jgi:hypothetical protein
VYPVISVFLIPEVKFLTNVPSASVIGQATKEALSSFMDQLSLRAQCKPPWLKLIKNPQKQNKMFSTKAAEKVIHV